MIPSLFEKLNSMLEFLSSDAKVKKFLFAEYAICGSVTTHFGGSGHGVSEDLTVTTAIIITTK